MGKKWSLKACSDFVYDVMDKVLVVKFSLNRLSDHFVALPLLKNNNTQKILSCLYTN